MDSKVLTLEKQVFGYELSSPDRQYLNELTSYSMNRISKEPLNNLKEQNKLENEIEEIAVGNYRSFVDSAHCIRIARLAIVNMTDTLHSLNQTLPEFENLCKTFSEDVKEISKTQQLNRLMIDNQSSLQNVLEIPLLMANCLQSGLYEEALDLYNFVTTLVKRHPQIAILQNLVTEMTETRNDLHKALLQLLANKIQLSMCLRAVGYLRRLHLYTEQELRSQFLSCRNAWLVDILPKINLYHPNLEAQQPSNLILKHDNRPRENSNNNTYYYQGLSKFVDLNRVHLFEIITQYRAIFLDDEMTTTTADSDQEEKSQSTHGLLFLWANLRVAHIIETLKQVLPLISDGTILANILEQSMYCGMSLARVGVDFRGQLISLFSRRVEDMFQGYMRAVTTEWQQALLQQHFYLPTLNLVKLGIIIDTDDSTPYAQLLEYPPLAVISNIFITAFNHLRPVAFIHLKPKLIQIIIETVTSLSQKLQQLSTADETQSGEKEHQGKAKSGVEEAQTGGTGDELEKLARACVHIFIPFISDSLDTIFSQKDLLPQTELNNLFSLLYFKPEEEEIVNPVEEGQTDTTSLSNNAPEQEVKEAEMSRTTELVPSSSPVFNSPATENTLDNPVSPAESNKSNPTSLPVPHTQNFSETSTPTRNSSSTTPRRKTTNGLSIKKPSRTSSRSGGGIGARALTSDHAQDSHELLSEDLFSASTSPSSQLSQSSSGNASANSPVVTPKSSRSNSASETESVKQAMKREQTRRAQARAAQAQAQSGHSQFQALFEDRGLTTQNQTSLPGTTTPAKGVQELVGAVAEDHLKKFLSSSRSKQFNSKKN